MLRTVTSHLSFDVLGPADLYLAVAVADGAYDRQEHLTVSHAHGQLDVEEMKGPNGSRVHRAASPRGRVVVDYRAQVSGLADPPAVEDGDLLESLRPSRYAQSDRLLAFAQAQFGPLEGRALLDAVVGWVRGHVSYVSGSSGPTDGATDTLLSRRGVCRDFAHLVIALLRARDVPARLVSVYAPGLSPMDFHAVVEAYVDGAWTVVDATGLAPRAAMLRIATGRDAADTAFLSNYGGQITLRAFTVTATTHGDLPADDGVSPTTLR
ncbi:transglutaminase family protein [Cellulomonas cellasea]|uniref:transglutaminase-like domain-containing protein n=1 Tax=Cellulomonas cellasea TaxID=43670 RepID=UPI0025A41A6D|nr:transglutaminase family protein [Cellulomonas cellasea]MDM8084161.1 transglutaminase family protein [Cellulomonas cellasea]